MIQLLYDHSFEGLLTAIFEVYEFKHQNVSIKKLDLATPDLFASQKRVITSSEKAERVWRKLESILAKDANVFLKAWLSELDNIEQCLLEVVRYALRLQSSPLTDFSNPHVLQLQQTLKMIEREKHRMEAFVRFERSKEDLYFAVIAPDFDVLPLLIPHFSSRYADQKWLIWDEKRSYGIHYDLKETEYVEFTGNKDIATKQVLLNEEEIKYQTLWKTYFSSTNIISRKNLALHLRHIPKRYWKNLTEKTGRE